LIFKALYGADFIETRTIYSSQIFAAHALPAAPRQYPIWGQDYFGR
jgi:hypothetical protein